MSQPFARYHSMMALIAAAMSGGMPPRLAFESVGPYRSAGKSRHSKVSPRFGRSRSVYRPHIGAKEQAKWAARHGRAA